MLLFFSHNYFIFSWIAKKCITTARFLWQSYYTQERTVHFLKRKLALCLTKKPINFVSLKVFFSEISLVNFFAVKLIRKINGIPSSS